ncbi:efflux RND transporter periplasmic adaptor subunit [Aliiglaciecola sp. 3_MG-2023]|uniref:efflux RND transporter periplasmic adaptor subunit n=1 Tax=Aliiglaciecola sp. 3_MG-2023 TaxID=3062644 RepID=UPI0026E3911D|nr:efflux RND transporter periplasmic adaptor subunit [Aliiglaciecola sp. 3_MG-2023]MDO6694255.1 efflux RND transporter periplasmic adaptor subunit [Aliiglaciecola sp. 3_MG-2023]
MMVNKLQGPELAVYRIQSKPLVQTVVATGRVTSGSRAQVGAQISGVIAERLVREGDDVQAGDVLAVLHDNEQLARVREAQAALAELRESSKPQADATLRQAEARFEQSSREAQRRKDLLQRKLISHEAVEQAVEQETEARAALEQAKFAAEMLAAGYPSDVAASERLAAARAALEKTIVRAQVSGTVLTRNAEPGDVVQPGRVLFEIARAGQTELLVPVDERNLSVLGLEQTALCVTDAYPDRPFSATLSFIAPAVDPERGSIDIRLQLEAIPDFLRQDMTVTVNIETGRRERALVVPNDVLDDIDGNSAHVWKVSNGRLQRTKVKIGLRGMGQTEITNGLVNGDLIIANIDSALEDGRRVRTREDDVTLPTKVTDAATARETPVKFE